MEGTELPDTWPIASTTFPVGPINMLEFTARSEYHAGYVQAKRRLDNGLSFLANYTYSKSMSDSPSFRSAAMEPEVPQDSFNPDADWGPAGCDIRHRFVASLIYQIPLSSDDLSGQHVAPAAQWVLGDWQVAVIHQAQSGFPFTISVFGDTANAGALLNVNPVRANVVPGASPYLPDDERSADGGSTPPRSRRHRRSRSAMSVETPSTGLACRKPTSPCSETSAWSADGARHQAGSLQPVQPHEPGDARAVREHAAIRQRHHGGHAGPTDSVAGRFTF